MIKLQIIPFSQIIEEDWTSFHQSCIDPVLFYQYPFLNAYAETTKNRVDVVIIKENNKTLIAMPGRFDVEKKIFYNLTYLGWDNLNFLISKNLPESILTTFFTELSIINLLIVYKNISQSCFETITKHTIQPISFKTFKCPFVILPNSYNSYLDTISVSFRRMVKNRTKFCDKNGVEFRLLSNLDKDSFKDASIALNQLHATRMDETDTHSKFLKFESQRFHQIIQSYNNCEFILIFQALKDEKVIGTIYGFVSSDRYAYFASGIDPNYSKYSLGVVLIGRIIDYLISHNYKYFDFLRGTEDYKYRWAKEMNQNYTVYSSYTFYGKIMGIIEYWKENKQRLGRKTTFINLKRFL